jgi:hypothetical protein
MAMTPPPNWNVERRIVLSLAALIVLAILVVYLMAEVQ